MYWIRYIFTTGLDWMLQVSRAIWSVIAPPAHFIRYRLGANGVSDTYQTIVLCFLAAVIVVIMFRYIPIFLRVVLVVVIVILTLPFFMATPAFSVMSHCPVCATG